MHKIVQLVFCVALCYGQNVNVPVQEPQENPTESINGLAERIGNFSIEALYHTSKSLQHGQNFIMSPITVWSALAVIAEGASGNTRNEINHLLRIRVRTRDATRSSFRNITNWLQVNTNTVQLAKVNTIFVNKERLPNQDFLDISKEYYQTDTVPIDFKDSVLAANVLNERVSNFTHGKIPNIVEPAYFQNTQMVLTSALYFKGQWTVPFNASLTEKAPFYDSNGQKIGEVNMMYNKYAYPFTNIRELQATVIELSYGNEQRLSMVIMVPDRGVSLEDMFKNFQKINLDMFFEKLRVSKEQYADEELDCYIPRFKIKSDIDLTNVLKESMGISNLFDPLKAELPFLARTPLYVSKVVHKAEIEVTEDGTEAAGVTAVELVNKIGQIEFHVNRPFTYLIIEKVTNSIVFGGFYKTPSLF